MQHSNQYLKKLRDSGLRPTIQRIKICEVLFNTDKTFHFTISDLVKLIENKANEKQKYNKAIFFAMTCV